MKQVSYKGMTFSLPDGDKTFFPKIYVFVDQVLDAINLLDIKPGGILLEAGLCFGVSSIAALSTGKFSVAYGFEPSSKNLALAKENAEINKVKLFGNLAAVSDRCGWGRIKLCSDKNIGGHVVSHVLTKDLKAVIPLTTLDRFCEKGRIDPSNISLVWCDTQGSEGFVLDGAEFVLRGGAPWVIELAPYLLERSGHGPEEMLNKVRPHFSYVTDLRSPERKLPVEEIITLYDYYGSVVKPGSNNSWHTNLLLWPR